MKIPKKGGGGAGVGSTFRPNSGTPSGTKLIRDKKKEDLNKNLRNRTETLRDLFESQIWIQREGAGEGGVKKLYVAGFRSMVLNFTVP